MKYTPAPWRVNYNGLIYNEANLHENDQCICVFNGLSKADPVWITDPETLKANARLIAAAPELLEILEVVVHESHRGTSGRLIISNVLEDKIKSLIERTKKP